MIRQANGCSIWSYTWQRTAVLQQTSDTVRVEVRRNLSDSWASGMPPRTKGTANAGPSNSPCSSTCSTPQNQHRQQCIAQRDQLHTTRLHAGSDEGSERQRRHKQRWYAISWKGEEGETKAETGRATRKKDAPPSRCNRRCPQCQPLSDCQWWGNTASPLVAAPPAVADGPATPMNPQACVLS